MAIPIDSGGTVSVTAKGLGLQSKFSPDDLNEYVNPAADPRLNSILKKLGSPLKQGIIQQTDDEVLGPQKYPYACRFMFNPTTLDVTYTANQEAKSPNEMTSNELAAIAVGPGSTTLSFSLLFDRTYEVAYGPTNTSPRDLRDVGVYRDIAALENIVGARFNFATDSKQVIQPMRMTPCYFIFGGGGGTVGLSFIGTIGSMSVTYSLFSERMVPTRAGVVLGVTQLLGRDLGDLTNNGGSLLQRAQARGRVVRNGQNIAPPPPARGSFTPGGTRRPGET